MTMTKWNMDTVIIFSGKKRNIISNSIFKIFQKNFFKEFFQKNNSINFIHLFKKLFMSNIFTKKNEIIIFEDFQ